MAELLALPASIAAVMQLATYGRGFAKVMYDVYCDVRMGRHEMEQFRIQVLTFSDTVGVAQASLRRYLKDCEGSPIIPYLLEKRVLEAIEQESCLVRGRLQDAKKKVVSMRSRSLLWTGILWSIKKSSILALHPYMESVKTSLGLLIITVQFEAIQTSARRDGNDIGQGGTELDVEM